MSAVLDIFDALHPKTSWRAWRASGARPAW